VTFRGDTPLPEIVIVAPPVLPPGFGVGVVGRSSPLQADTIASNAASNVYLAIRIVG
jgi:hypothetical protein